MKAEMQRRSSNTTKVLAYFLACPGQWVGTHLLEQLGGRNAWRTRVSEARAVVKAEGGDIENRQRRIDGAVISEYRLVSSVPVAVGVQHPTVEYRNASLF